MTREKWSVLVRHGFLAAWLAACVFVQAMEARAQGADGDRWHWAGAGLIVFGVIVGITLILNTIWRWGYSLAFNRRTCRITGSLEFGLDVIDGTVTILSRQGCRFVPVNAGARLRLNPLGFTDPIYVQVGGVRVRGSIGFFSSEHVAVYFDERISGAVQSEMFAESSTDPVRAPRPLRPPRAWARAEFRFGEDEAAAAARLGVPVAVVGDEVQGRALEEPVATDVADAFREAGIGSEAASSIGSTVDAGSDGRLAAEASSNGHGGERLAPGE